MRGIKKFFITLCCCIKQKCVTFVEHRGRLPPKKDEIVKEIMAELERIEAGKPESVAGTNPAECECQNFLSITKLYFNYPGFCYSDLKN